MNKIFLSIIGVELLLTIYFFLDRRWWSMCDPHSLLNPFGITQSVEKCWLMVVQVPNPLFYITVDILIVSVISYLLLYIARKIELYVKTK